MPAHFSEKPELRPVPFPVPFYLSAPELHIALGQDKIPATLVSVPEAAVDEDGGPVFPQDDVRLPG